MREPIKLKDCREELEYIRQERAKLDLREVGALKEIKELLNQADSDGWEGLMLNKDTKWKNKRNNGILKVKSFKHADILCTGVVEGDGKYKGTLGNIICNYKGFDLSIGSGFLDSDRDYYWKHKNEIVGKIIQVKYKCETKK